MKKLLFAAAALTAMSAPALAKEWKEMNGAERRMFVIAYIAREGYDCPKPKMSISEQEKELVGHTWGLVETGIQYYYCSKKSVGYIATMHSGQ